MAACPRSLKRIVKNFDTLFVHLETKRMRTYLFGLATLFLSPVTAFAGEIMFEGYYKIELFGKHVGYQVQRYEFDPKTKSFEATTFLRLKLGDVTKQESVKAKANDKFQPLSYQFTSLENDKTSGIDATFKGEVMTLKKFTSEKKNEVRNETYKIPKDSFMSTFLMFVLLKKDFPLNQPFKYSGIAEELGVSSWGKTLVESKEIKGKVAKIKVLNSFEGQDSICNVAALPDPSAKDKFMKAEIVDVEVPASGLTSKLVANAQSATEGQTVPTKTLISLFGSVPSGKVNVVASPPAEK